MELEKYLSQLHEIEIRLSGMVPMDIVKLGNKEIWLINFQAGKYWRSKLIKRALYLRVDDPKQLRKVRGTSSGRARQYDFHMKHIQQNRVIDHGEAKIKWRINPDVTGWFSAGTVFDISEFMDMKTLKTNQIYRVRIQKPAVEQSREPDLDVTIERIK